jgi:hypothetical protein
MNLVLVLASGRVRVRGSHSQEQRAKTRLKEVKREKVRERKGRGGESSPNSFVSNPSFLFMLFNFLLANNPTNMIL